MKNKSKYPPLDLAAPVIFALVFIMTFTYSQLEPNVQEVDSSYVRTHKDLKGYLLVDTREEEVYEGKSPRRGIPGGHINGAVNFPLDDIGINAAPAALAGSGLTKKVTLILYCNSGASSGKFAETLVNEYGYDPLRVKAYRGSVMDWIKDPYNRLYPEDHESGLQD